MTILMDNKKESSSREAVQILFNKNVELEKRRRKAAQARIPSDPNTWQQMRENYEAIIIEDYVFAEQHDIEYALWQLHYRRIEELRSLFNAALSSAGSTASQNGKVPSRSGPDRITKIRTQLKTFLSEATGFYHDLMLKIRSKYGLSLGYFSDDPDNHITMLKDEKKYSEVKRGLSSCHRSLIYLGDLARYKGLYGVGDSKARDFMAASSYYLQASSLWPSSGNPHHQLAILAGYSNDELVSIYRYFRSLAVDVPFVTARDNLIIAFEKNRQNYTKLLGDSQVTLLKTTPSRMSGKGRGKVEIRPSFKENKSVASSLVKERTSNNLEILKGFVTRFVRLNGILFTLTSLETFAEVFSAVKNDMLELLSSGPDESFNFGLDGIECRLTIIRLIATIIFTVQNLNKENENQSYADILQRSVLLQNAFTASFELMGCMFERCYQLNDPSTSYLVPGIMVFLEWLACRHDVAVSSELVEDNQVIARSFFWTQCVSLLNKFLSIDGMLMDQDEDETCFSNLSKFDESETANCHALAEDFELRGFLPLVPAQLILDFSRKRSFGGESKREEKFRIKRIIAAGKALADVVRIGHEGVYFDMQLKQFVIGIEPPMPHDYLVSSTLESNLDMHSIDFSKGDQMASVLPKLDVDIEAEDEDEVIVFKPSTIEKNVDEYSSKFSSSEVHASVGGDGTYNFAYANGSLLRNDNFTGQNATSSSMKLPTAFSDITSHYLEPVQPSTTKWRVDQAQIVNGLSHMHLMEDDSLLKSDLKDQCGVSQPAPLSLPNLSFPLQSSQASLSSKFDSVMFSGAASDSLCNKQTSFMNSGLKKNPVSRPVRHIGPPPGFGSVRSKVVDESARIIDTKNENSRASRMDDYSWLDGYHFPSHQSAAFSNSISQELPMFHSVSNGNNSMDITSYPFPGKLSSALQLQTENHNGFQDRKFSESTDLYSEQQLPFQEGNLPPVGLLKQYQVQSGNQQSAGPPQLYQGQSIWDDHFLV